MLLFSNFDKEAGLVEVCDILAITSFEVLCHGNLSIVPNEPGIGGCALEVNILHLVSALVAPVCDDRASTKLHSDQLLKPTFIVIATLLDFINAIEASRSRHEFENVVDCERATKLRLEG